MKVNFKILEKSIAAALVVCMFISFTAFSAKCEGVRQSVVRMHVIANSDSAEDQALKLKVRDRIAEMSGELFGRAKSREEAEAAVSENLEVLRLAAEEEVRTSGYGYAVEAELVNTYFPTRTYQNVTLPAGYYDALQIRIGEAAGKNWWCVIFPALCIPVASDRTELGDVLTEDEEEIVENEPRYEIKFKSVEIFEAIRNWLRGEDG